MADNAADSSFELLDGRQEVVVYFEESYSGEEDEKEKVWLKDRIPIVHNLALAQILFAVVSIGMSAFLLGCRPCGTGSTAGSGVWCSVFFLVLGAMCRGNKDDMHTYKIIRNFGLGSAYFAILMLVIEAMECATAFQEKPQNLIAIPMHFTLCVIAAAEFVLIIATIRLHKRPRDHVKKEMCDSVKTSTDDCINTCTS